MNMYERIGSICSDSSFFARSSRRAVLGSALLCASVSGCNLMPSGCSPDERLVAPEQLMDRELPDISGSWAGPAPDFSGDACTARILWATWCGSCLRELAQLESWNEKLSSPPNFELVHSDARIEEDKVEFFIRANQLPFGSYVAEGGTRANHGVSVIPTMFIADADNIVRHVHVGIHNFESFAEALGDSGCDNSLADAAE